MTVSKAKSRQRELGLRLMSAAVLIPLALYFVWAGGITLALFCVLIAALMAYEWVRMSVSPTMTAFVSLAIIPPAAAGVASLYTDGNTAILISLTALMVCAGIAALLHPLQEERRTSAWGIVYTAGFPLAMFGLRDGAWDGAAAALIVMGIVWGSDTAAFFTGRTFGGPSLSSESPNKTWSGAIGAVVFSMMCGALAAYLTGGSWILWIVAGGVISVFTQCGDLFESILKRRFGVKDSSGILPGHGGVIDRVDGLGLACVFVLLGFIVSPSLVSQLGLS
jgi:phosphatidate cytidylyltransferase